MLNHLKFLLPAIGEDESRKKLMWVKCTVENDLLTMIAADGFIIKKVEINNKHLPDGSEFYIDREAIESAIKLSDSVPDEKCCEVCFENCVDKSKPKKISIFLDKFKIGELTEVRYKEYNFDYPDIDNILNANEPVSIDSIAVSNFLIINCLDGFENYAQSEIKFVKLLIGKGESVVIPKIKFITEEHIGYSAFSMPVKINDKKPKP